MLSSTWQLAWMILRGLLPYPDPIRRARFRRRAFRLITCEPWPGSDATGDDAAQLALLRLLWLQRQIRRAVRGRHREAAALLARSTVETCILGLYSLHDDDAPKALEAREGKAMRAVTAYLTMDGLVSETAIEAAVDTLAKGPRLPNVAEMAERIESERDRAAAVGLYREYYVPLSHFFTHPSGFTLMRHVRPGKKVRHRPEAPWPRRSAVRLGDASAGLLATAIAEKAASPAGPLRKYAAAHADRILTPVSTMGAGGILHKADWRRLPATIRAVMDLRRYLASPGAAAEPAECEARIHAGIAEAFRFLRFDEKDETVMQVAVDDAVCRILRSLDSPAEDQAGAR